MSFINPSLLQLASTDAATESALPKPEADEQAARDKALAELLAALDPSVANSAAPILPDALVNYYLEKAGFASPAPQVTKLLGLAAQKFVSDIVTDAHAYAKARTLPAPKGPATAGKPPDKQKTVLTMDDLSAALNEYGIPASRAPYYL